MKFYLLMIPFSFQLVIALVGENECDQCQILTNEDDCNVSQLHCEFDKSNQVCMVKPLNNDDCKYHSEQYICDLYTGCAWNNQGQCSIFTGCSNYILCKKNSFILFLAPEQKLENLARQKQPFNQYSSNDLNFQLINLLVVQILSSLNFISLQIVNFNNFLLYIYQISEKSHYKNSINTPKPNYHYQQILNFLRKEESFGIFNCQQRLYLKTYTQKKIQFQTSNKKTMIKNSKNKFVTYKFSNLLASTESFKKTLRKQKFMSKVKKVQYATKLALLLFSIYS